MPNQTKQKTGISSFFEKDIFFKVLLALVWCNQILVRYFRAFLIRLPYVKLFADYIIIFAYIIAIVLAIPYIVKKIKLNDVFFMLFVVMFGLISYVFYPENIDILNEKFWTFVFTVLPLYCIGVCIDIKRDYRLIYYASIASILGRLGYFFFIEGGVMGGDLLAGDMYASYTLLPHVCVVLMAMLKKINLVNFIVSAAGIVFIFSLGSRGPLICILVATVLYLLFYKKFKHPFISKTILVAVALLAVMSFDSIMSFLSDISSDLGMSTRVFDLFASGDFLTSHGREVISDTLYEAIEENSVLGYGLYGDRLIANGSYAHNLFLELWVDFGIILGSLIIIAIAYVILKAMLKFDVAENYIELLIPLIVVGFVKLFMSSSIVEEGFTFILIGMCRQIITSEKESVGNKNEIVA